MYTFGEHMKHTCKNYLILIIGLLFSTSSYPISKPTTVFLSLASGLGIGTLTYLQNDRDGIVAGLVGIGTATLVYLIAREYTPERKFERAKNLLNHAESGLFIPNQHVNDRVFFDAMHTAYATYDLPYAVAYYDLTDRLRLLNSARDLFNDACSEDTTLSCLAQEYQTFTANLTHIVIEAIKRIKQSKEFTSQLKIYEKRRLEEKRLAIEERKVAARESQARAQHNQAFAQHNSAFAQHRQANA